MEDMEYPWEKNKIVFSVIVASICFLILTGNALGDIITRLPSNEKIVALTFDACETKTPAYFDSKILDFLMKEKVPFTLFMTGKFAKRNKEKLLEISGLSFVEIENHSLNHIQHMEALKHDDVIKEVEDNGKLLFSITNRPTKFFRFPGGNYDSKTLKTVESMGYKVVHWSFASGDADKHIPKERLYTWLVSKTKPGSILIFHINGRGYHTGDMLPKFVKELRQKGYRFVKLEDILR